MKMDDLVQRYLRVRRDEMGQATHDGHRHVLERLAASWDRERHSAVKLTEDWLRDWLYEFRRGGVGGRGNTLANNGYNKKLEYVRSFVAYQVRRSVFHPDALDACKKAPKDEPKEYLRLTIPQIVHMVKTCEDPWERWLLAFASQTMGRESELLSTRIAHLHLDRNELYWYRRKVKDEDMLPMTRQLREEWDRWAMVYQEACGPLDRNRGWFLLPARWSHPQAHIAKRWTYRPNESPGGVGHIIQKHAARVLGAPVEHLKGQGVHITRRSMARGMYDKLVSTDVPEPTAVNRVQTMLGHDDPRTTMIYIGVQPDRQKRNELLMGSSLLWVEDQENVVQLRAVGDE